VLSARTQKISRETIGEIKTRQPKNGCDQPSVWRSVSWKTARSVSAVVIANGEYRG
jgi:hypothetical protein